MNNFWHGEHTQYILCLHGGLRISTVRPRTYTLYTSWLRWHLIPAREEQRGATGQYDHARALSRLLQNKSHLYSFERANAITLLVSVLRTLLFVHAEIAASPSTIAGMNMVLGI